MSEDNNTQNESNDASSADAAQNAPQSETATPEADTKNPAPEPQTEATPQSDAADPLDTLREENAGLKEKLVRTLADMENLRARTEREKSDMAKYAIANFAREMLPVCDNMDRAIAAVPDDAADKDPVLKTLMEGVEMTGRELLNALQRHGVKQIEAEGTPFDPNLHQAMFEVPNPDVNAGLVVQVVQPGYTIGERVLRPAGVGVSKGGAKIAKEDAPAESAPAAETETPEPEQAQETPESTAPEQDAPQSNETPSTSDHQPGENLDKSA